MLTKLIVKNFKSIGGNKGIDLILKPLTILVGPNGSGKSGILESLVVLAQSIEGNGLTTEGNILKYSEHDIAYKHELEKWISVEIWDDENIGVRYEYKPDTGEATETVMGERTTTIKMIGDRREGFKFAIHDENGKFITLQERVDFLSPLSKHKYYTLPNICRFPSQQDVAKLSGKLKDKVFYISSKRGDIPSSSTISGPVSNRGVGVYGENIIQILSYLGSPKYESARKKIIKWCEKFGLVSLWAGPSQEGIKAEYKDQQLKCPVNLAFAGHGSRQITSVITQLFWSLPGDIILIEEPEISLHPQAQIELCELFAEAIKEERQIIITTHTSLLLLSLSYAIFNGFLTAKDVAVYEITKNVNGTCAKELKVNEEGYIKGWVPSFARAEEIILNRWLENLQLKDETNICCC